MKETKMTPRNVATANHPIETDEDAEAAVSNKRSAQVKASARSKPMVTRPMVTKPGVSEGASDDVVIIGGGLVGGTLGILLATAGLNVRMIDRMDPSVGLDDGFDGRSTAIALATQRVLVAAGLWPALEPRACAMKDIRVADGAAPLFLHYDHRDVGDAPFGFMIENRHLRQAIHARYAELPNLTVQAPCTLATAPWVEGAPSECGGENALTLGLADGDRVSAPLVVAADGKGSFLRQAAGIKTTGWRYKQWGLVCTVDHDEPHLGTAIEHFLPSGPFAILPLIGQEGREGHQSSLVWTEREDLIHHLYDLDEKTFLAELLSRFGDFLGAVSVFGPRWKFPLGLHYAERAVDGRLVLVGDALHAIHPIAGQGLNMGLRDIAALYDVVTEARAAGLDIGAPATLERYERWRRFDNATMMGVTDVLNRLFSNDIVPLHMARSAGLGVVNRLAPLRKLFMRHAMGEVGELPSIMRPAD